MICLPLPFFSWIQRKCVASSRLEDISGWVRQPQRTFQNRSSKSPLIMTNFNVQNLWNVKTFSAEIFGGETFGGANGSAGEKSARAAGGVDTPHRVWESWVGCWVHSRTPFSLSAGQHTKRGLYSNTRPRNIVRVSRRYFLLSSPPFFSPPPCKNQKIICKKINKLKIKH